MCHIFLNVKFVDVILWYDVTIQMKEKLFAMVLFIRGEGGGGGWGVLDQYLGEGEPPRV